MSDLLEQLAELAERVGLEAAELVAERRRAGVVVAGTKSSVIDVVTEADRASESLIRERILSARPGDAILGEEEGAVTGTSGVQWIVDPIDGTVNYLYGIGEYAVSIAAYVDGVPSVGVVIDVERRSVYRGVRGRGATRDGVTLRARPVPPFEQRLVFTGFGYDSAVRAGQAATVARLLPKIRDIRRFGSCALDLCHLAEGLGDGYVEEGPQPWDHAAGAVICTEAGVHVELVAGAGGQAVVVAAPEPGFAEFRRVLSECGFFA